MIHFKSRGKICSLCIVINRIWSWTFVLYTGWKNFSHWDKALLSQMFPIQRMSGSLTLSAMSQNSSHTNYWNWTYPTQAILNLLEQWAHSKGLSLWFEIKIVAAILRFCLSLQPYHGHNCNHIFTQLSAISVNEIETSTTIAT